MVRCLYRCKILERCIQPHLGKDWKEDFHISSRVVIRSVTEGTASGDVNEKFNTGTGLSVMRSTRLVISLRKWDHNVEDQLEELQGAINRFPSKWFSELAYPRDLVTEKIQ